ncbi:MAG: RecX family transcriptional regulator [Ktedonobacterales bacterium]
MDDTTFPNSPSDGAMTITRLEPQTRTPGRYNVWLDGRFAFGLDGALMLEEGLAVGQTLTPAMRAHLETAEEERTVFEAALRFLESRPRSKAEVRRRLLRPHPKRATPSAAVVDRALATLEQLDLLDDVAFAAYWAEQRERFSPRSARAITQELRQRGVDHETAAAALDPAQDTENALTAARKRLHSIRTDDYNTFRTKLGGFLQRRGFSYGVTRDVVRQLWAETHDGGPDDDNDEEPLDV